MTEPLIQLEEAETLTAPKARTVAKHRHIVRIKIDDKGEEIPIPLCDAFDIVGTGTDTQGAYYRLIQYTDKHTHHPKLTALPCAEIGTHQGWQRLQRLGLTVYSGRQKREWLADYIQDAGSREHWTVAEKAGWHSGAYILPNGEVLNTSEETRLFYNGDKSQATAYAVSGSLKDWQDNVAKYAKGNSRLCLALGIAFAAPLLPLLKTESGGFHLQSDSSTGKTTAAFFALSVFGEPEPLKITWSGTGIGFNNIAAARNDGLLVLDEIHQATPKVVSQTVYSIMNGVNKVQGAKDGGNRHLTRWRVLVLSTGEVSPETMLRNKADWNAGQNVRLPTLHADTGKHGIYENLHGFASGALLSEYLNQAVDKYYGIAGREFIQLLNEERIQAAKDTKAAFMQMLPNLNGQARRVAQRFALVAAALEIAAPITGLAAGVGLAGVKTCFDEWLECNGTGNFEEERIIKQAVDFFTQYAYGKRFAPKGALREDHDIHHAGYYERVDGKRVIYLLPVVFQTEICKGFEERRVQKVLYGTNWLMRNPNGRWKHQLSGGGYFYKFKDAQPPEQYQP